MQVKESFSRTEMKLYIGLTLLQSRRRSIVEQDSMVITDGLNKLPED